MRKFSFFIFILVSSIYCLHSKQYTVSNNAGIKAQFSNLQRTIDSVAAAGDTIYVSCSPNNYALSSSALVINKPIHLIGEGYNNTNKYNSLLEKVYMYADSVIIEGFSIVDLYIGYNGLAYKSVKNTLLRFNKVVHVNLYSLDQSIIYNNYIEALIFQSGSIINIIVANNVLGRSSFNGNASNILISNNVFLSNCALSSYGCSYPSNNLIIQNNIFYRTQPRTTNYSSFVNNLTYATGNDTLPYGTNTGTNNFINIDPKFNNADASLQISNFFNYDLTLKDDSPCKNAGTDSTDLGLTGGLYPWPLTSDGKLDISGNPLTPIIQQFDLLNPVIGKDGTLRFNTQVIRKK